MNRYEIYRPRNHILQSYSTKEILEWLVSYFDRGDQSVLQLLRKFYRNHLTMLQL